MEIKAAELGVKEIRKVVKILGVHFTHNQNLFYKMNFETIEKSLRQSLKGWSWRGLTLQGRIQGGWIGWISTPHFSVKKKIRNVTLFEIENKERKKN